MANRRAFLGSTTFASNLLCLRHIGTNTCACQAGCSTDTCRIEAAAFHPHPCRIASSFFQDQSFCVYCCSTSPPLYLSPDGDVMAGTWVSQGLSLHLVELVPVSPYESPSLGTASFWIP
ncbi:unnamed protein product [Nezara viridula]|uniref:Uncharacterized protein n=1 Tax=Nezara viridula TaxID=85310 RepID=A0A9P0ECH4_NEZVI|nr:unnamed protein product [Nezara viridula]